MIVPCFDVRLAPAGTYRVLTCFQAHAFDELADLSPGSIEASTRLGCQFFHQSWQNHRELQIQGLPRSQKLDGGMVGFDLGGVADFDTYLPVLAGLCNLIDTQLVGSELPDLTKLESLVLARVRKATRGVSLQAWLAPSIWEVLRDPLFIESPELEAARLHLRNWTADVAGREERQTITIFDGREGRTLQIMTQGSKELTLCGGENTRVAFGTFPMQLSDHNCDCWQDAYGLLLGLAHVRAAAEAYTKRASP